jgi:hypothetical protein
LATTVVNAESSADAVSLVEADGELLPEGELPEDELEDEEEQAPSTSSPAASAIARAR